IMHFANGCALLEEGVGQIFFPKARDARNHVRSESMRKQHKTELDHPSEFQEPQSCICESIFPEQTNPLLFPHEFRKPTSTLQDKSRPENNPTFESDPSRSAEDHSPQ